MTGSLSRIDQHQHSIRRCHRRQSAHLLHSTRHVRSMSQHEQSSRPGRQQSLQLVLVQQSRDSIETDQIQLNIASPLKMSQRTQHGIMIQLRRDHAVPTPQQSQQHKIQTLGAATGQHDLLR